MQVGEFAGVAALAKRLNLDEAGQRIVVDAHRIVWARQQMRERRFANKRQAAEREAIEQRQSMKQPFKRRPELIFGAPEIAGLSSLARA